MRHEGGRTPALGRDFGPRAVDSRVRVPRNSETDAMRRRRRRSAARRSVGRNARRARNLTVSLEATARFGRDAERRSQELANCQAQAETQTGGVGRQQVTAGECNGVHRKQQTEQKASASRAGAASVSLDLWFSHPLISFCDGNTENASSQPDKLHTTAPTTGHRDWGRKLASSPLRRWPCRRPGSEH